MVDVTQNGGKGSINKQEISVYNSPDAIKSPSIIASLIEILVESKEVNDPSLQEITTDFNAYDIDDKLEVNKVIKYYELITQYAEYFLLIENGYDSINEVKPNGKELILGTINRIYKEKVGDILKKNNISPGEYEQKLPLIQENSDNIIESVIKSISELCKEGKNSSLLHLEEIYEHVPYIIFHAFIECKILEKPK